MDWVKVLSSIVLKVTYIDVSMTTENCEIFEYHKDFSARVLLLTHKGNRWTRVIYCIYYVMLLVKSRYSSVSIVTRKLMSIKLFNFSQTHPFFY